MDIHDVKKEMRSRAILFSLVAGTALNVLNSDYYSPVFFRNGSFPVLGLEKILATFLVLFILFLYFQRFFTAIHLALLNIKNAFFMVNRQNKVVFVSNKLVEQLNENETTLRKYSYCDLIGIETTDLIAKFGFSWDERNEFLAKFDMHGEIDGQNQILGRRVNGKRYGYISSSNLVLVPDPAFPAQGMFIPKNDLSQKEITAVMMLAKAAESKDKCTGDHILRLRSYSKAMGIRLGFSEDDLEILDFGSILHDVGKIAIEDKVLNKPGNLNPEEWEVMKTHALKGGEIIRYGNDPFFSKVAVIPEQHHENFDGTGYPRGLKGEEISRFAKIVAIVDTFDALESVRPYKQGFPMEIIYGEMERARDKKFDPIVLDIFYEVLMQERILWKEFLTNSPSKSFVAKATTQDLVKT